MAFRRQACLLELYSGTGVVSSVASRVLGVSCITVDRERSRHPHMCMDLTTWNEAHTQQLLEMLDGRAVVLFASPPCEHYSIANTTGKRDLEHADLCVSKVFDIRDLLTEKGVDVLALIMENPRTGLLKTRPVVTERDDLTVYDVDYCAYGKTYQKPTRIWTCPELPGFVGRLCDDACLSKYRSASTGRMVHLHNITDLDYDERIALPEPLVVQLMNAVRGLLERANLPNRSERPITVDVRKDDSVLDSSDDDEANNETYEVECIVDVQEDDEEVLLLRIMWTGYPEDTEWYPYRNLCYDLGTYSFVDDACRERALKALECIGRPKKRSRKN